MALDELTQARLDLAFAPYLARMHGTARQAEWEAEDGWLVVYTTTRVEGGPTPGKFVTMAYKPTGKGARTNPQHWQRVYYRAFTTRKAAKNRALALYRQHSPRWAERHPG